VRAQFPSRAFGCVAASSFDLVSITNACKFASPVLSFSSSTSLTARQHVISVSAATRRQAISASAAAEEFSSVRLGSAPQQQAMSASCCAATAINLRVHRRAAFSDAATRRRRRRQRGAEGEEHERGNCDGETRCAHVVAATLQQRLICVLTGALP